MWTEFHLGGSNSCKRRISKHRIALSPFVQFCKTYKTITSTIKYVRHMILNQTIPFLSTEHVHVNKRLKRRRKEKKSMNMITISKRIGRKFNFSVCRIVQQIKILILCVMNSHNRISLYKYMHERRCP